MNSHNPFNTGGSGCTNDFRSADQLVDRIIGDAYHVVKEVYLALGNLSYIYNYLQKYGLIITVDSEDAIKDIPLSIGKFARIYSKSDTSGYYFTDYLYVADDTTGIPSNDPSATGSWISTKATGSNASFVRIWKYRAVADGETVIQLPTDMPIVDVQTIYVQGSRQDVGEGFVYNEGDATLTLADELDAGNLVTVIIGISDPDMDIDIFALLKKEDGASQIGTLTGETVQDVLTSLREEHQQLEENLVANTGASGIGTLQGIPLQDLLSWATPQAFGAKGNGISDDTDALYAAFKSTYETIHVPKGTYLITRKLKCALTKNLRVICAPGVVFKLADNVRKNMMVFVGDRTHNFEWFGGEFDGNWAGQGEETLNSSGSFNDMSHGFIVSLFNEVRLDTMYVHSFRGHSMNHAGNKKLHASNLRFNSHIAQAFPQGGSRGDGITGCSEDVLIENVYGFTTDDMVAVFAGILWVEGGTEADSAMVTNLDYLTCKSVTIRNVNPWYKTSDIDPNTTVYTWNGVVVGGQGGIGVEKVHISNVKGYTQYSGVRVGASDPVGSAPATDYWNTMGSVIIDDISVRVAGTSTNQHLYNPIRIGSLTAASTGDAHTCLINSLALSNIQLWPTGNNRTLIGIGYTTIYNLDINNISIRGNYADDTYYAIHCAGDRQIAQVSINGVTHNPPSTSSDTIAQAQLILYWAVTYSSTAAKISFSGVPARRSLDGSSYLPNLFIANGSVAPYVYGFDAVIRASNNFHSLPRVKGIYCTDRYLGRVRVSPNTGLWEFLDYATTYESSTFGKPSASTFSNYGLITWLPGMVVKCVGSPNESIDSWVYNSNGDWQMQGKTVTNNMVSLITVSSTPSIIAPYAMMTSPVYNDATWPESYGAVVLYGGHQNLRAGAYEDFVSTTGNTYRRTWNTNTSAWNSWYRLPRVVDVPASATASGVAGNIAISSTHLYVCVATNTWVRTALATW